MSLNMSSSWIKRTTKKPTVTFSPRDWSAVAFTEAERKAPRSLLNEPHPRELATAGVTFIRTPSSSTKYPTKAIRAASSSIVSSKSSTQASEYDTSNSR